MKILLLNWRDIRHPKSGGAEIITMQHAKGWVKRGHSVTWFTSSYSGATSEETIEGVHIIHTGGSLTVYALAPWYIFWNSKKYDVIIDEVHGIPFFAKLFTNTPVVIFIHEIAGDIWDYMYTFPINKIGKWLEAWMFTIYKKNRFWTIAQSTVEELVKRGIERKNCIAIPNQIIVNESEEKNNKIASYQKEKNPTYIFVSRVVKMKGIEEVIKAFSFILREQKEARLWIVGGGDVVYLKELKNMMEEYQILSHVTFFGRVSEEKKMELMRKAHILLHASVKEGWGLVVMEAASVGTPSVVYNVPGLIDVVQGGKTGVIVKENSPQDMAKEAIQLYVDVKRYEKLQYEAKQWINSIQWNILIKNSESFLEESITN